MQERQGSADPMHFRSVADGQNLATRRVLGRRTERFGPGWPGAAA